MDTPGSRRLDNFLTARQNLRWFASPEVTAGMELKEQSFSGKSVSDWLASTQAKGGAGYFGWSKTILNEPDFALTAKLDRAWLDYTQQTWQLTVGRQRIAWGTNLVWNPIDIFNPSSPLDFDNEEKPGGDGIRIQRYIGAAAKFEAAFEARREKPSTAAGLFKTNFRGYDLFLMVGSREGDMVGGFAWAGQVGGAGFRGEALTTTPAQNAAETVTEAALSADYAFPNSIYIHSEALYNSLGAGGAGGYKWELAAEEGWLTPARWSLFGEISAHPTPLLLMGAGFIWNPNDGSSYLTPSIYYSLWENVDAGALALLSQGKTGTEFGDGGRVYLARLKWSY